LLLAGFLVTCCGLLVSAGTLADEILLLVYRRRRESFFSRMLKSTLSRRRLLALAVTATAVSVVLIWPGLLEYWRTGHVTLHWSRPLAAVFLLQLALLAATHAVLQKIVSLWSDEIAYRRSVEQRPGE
jgi:hypothetical protein